MDTPGSEKKRAKRIAHHFILYARQANPLEPTGDWDVSTITNISKTGVFFHSFHNYKLGSKLEIRLILSVQKKCMCWGIVVRCLPSKRIKNTYEVAVALSDIEEESKKAFDETLEFFIQKEEEKK